MILRAFPLYPSPLANQASIVRGRDGGGPFLRLAALRAVALCARSPLCRPPLPVSLLSASPPTVFPALASISRRCACVTLFGSFSIRCVSDRTRLAQLARISATMPPRCWPLRIAGVALVILTALSFAASQRTGGGGGGGGGQRGHAPSAPSLSASARAAESRRADQAGARREDLEFAMGEINRIAAAAPIDTHAADAAAGTIAAGGAAATAASIPTAPPSPPRWSLHSVPFAHPIDESWGEIVQRRSVYRTVRGFDEKRQRPIVYQTLVQEDYLTRAVVDRTATYHLVLRPVLQAEVDAAVSAAESARLKECAASEEPACAAPIPPAPSSLLHAVVGVSTDFDGSRALTTLRSANRTEVAAWWATFMARGENAQEQEQADAAGGATASARMAAMQETFLHELDRDFRSLPLKLQRRATLSTESLCAPSADSDCSEGSLRVMSVNIWNTNHWSYRIPLLTSVLRSSAPHLIGFQEVRALKASPPGRPAPKESRWQVSDLAAMLPLHEYTYSPAMGFREGSFEFVHEGLAVFSSLPIHSVSALKLTRDAQDGQDFHQRMCLRAAVHTPWGHVHMLTTHLSLSAAARKRTLPEVGALARSMLPQPSILVGDFNAQWEDEGGPHMLADSLSGAAPSASPSPPPSQDQSRSPHSLFQFRDVWGQLHGTTPASEQRGWTFHSWDHRSRIDFVMHNSRGDTRTAEAAATTAAATSEQAPQSAMQEGYATSPSLTPLSIAVVGSEGQSIAHIHPSLAAIGGVSDMKDTIFPSDHMFLLSTFKLRREQTAEQPMQQPPATEAPKLSLVQQQVALSAALAREAAANPHRKQPLAAGIGLDSLHDEL